MNPAKNPIKGTCKKEWWKRKSGLNWGFWRFRGALGAEVNRGLDVVGVTTSGQQVTGSGRRSNNDEQEQRTEGAAASILTSAHRVCDVCLQFFY